MYVAFQGSIPKDDQFPSDNEDVLNRGSSGTRLALSDGASESFDSRTWAGILSSCYVIDPNCSTAWLHDAVIQYERSYTREDLTWSKLAAYERGSFATLLGVEFLSAPNRLSIFAIGDTSAMLMDGTSLLKVFPYQLSEDFNTRPQLLSTNEHLNTFVFSEGFWESRRITWDLSTLENPVLLCMTDALAQWLLRRNEEGSTAWQNLSAIRSVEEFNCFVTSERTRRAMRVDDTTLAVVQFGKP